MLVALPHCVGMISTPNCVVGHCFRPRLTAGPRIVGAWSTSLEKFREIFVGGRPGKTRFPSYISSFILRKRKKNSEILLSKTDRYILIILAGGPPWGKNNVGKAQRKDAKEGPRERAQEPENSVLYVLISDYFSENIKNWRNTIWGRESTPVAIPAVNWDCCFLTNWPLRRTGRQVTCTIRHDGVDKSGNGNGGDSNALRHCAFTSSLLYIHRALFCHFIIYNSLLLLLAPLPLHPTNSGVLSFVT